MSFTFTRSPPHRRPDRVCGCSLAAQIVPGRTSGPGRSAVREVRRCSSRRRSSHEIPGRRHSYAARGGRRGVVGDSVRENATVDDPRDRGRGKRLRRRLAAVRTMAMISTVLSIVMAALRIQTPTVRPCGRRCEQKRAKRPRLHGHGPSSPIVVLETARTLAPGTNKKPAEDGGFFAGLCGPF